MIILIHSNSLKPVAVEKDGENLVLPFSDCTTAFWHLAEKYPDELIFWCERNLQPYLNRFELHDIFHHDLIMASYAVKMRFFPDAIGYIDQLPFVNVNREVNYPSWKMSADIGGIKGRTLLRFKERFGKIKDFQMLLNSVAKLGQQNGLFCYSAPQLVKREKSGRGKQRLSFDCSALRTGSFDSRSGQATLSSEQDQPGRLKGIKTTASTAQLFAFVYSHYKSIRLFLLFWCFIKYEKSFPLFSFLAAFFNKKYFRNEVDLSDIEIRSDRNSSMGKSIDVIIPTMGRREYLQQVLEDLKQQTHLPEKVIVVEQNPAKQSVTDLPELHNAVWPFKVIHHFINQTGACNARNLALEEVNAHWVFFADDDIRLKPELLENGLKELERLGLGCLNMNCKQEGEATVFPKIKQWGSFGSGTSLVNARYCKKLRFDEVFEYGFGEDQDYGMQLRLAGCDIIYHPGIEILHLKAPRGGFREEIVQPWEKDEPKPSPTLMAFMKKYYSPEQLRGYKVELFLRFYNKQKVKNPKKYLKLMRIRWKRCEEWTYQLRTKKGFIRE